MIPICYRPWRPEQGYAGGQRLYQRLYRTMEAFIPWDELPDPVKDEFVIHALSVLEAAVPLEYEALQDHLTEVRTALDILGEPR